jgi:hypothetical protein
MGSRHRFADVEGLNRSSGTKEDIEEVQKAKVKFRSSKAPIWKDEHAEFSGSITAAYDNYLGPTLSSTLNYLSRRLVTS